MLCKNIKYSKILSSCHHVIMSSCHLPIPLFSVYHCMRRNIGKLSKTSFFTGKYRDFFLRKFDFLRVSGAFWGGDSVGLRWDFSVIMKIWWGVSDPTLWVLNENFEINDEILGSPMIIWISPMKIWRSPMRWQWATTLRWVSNGIPKMKILSQTRT